MSYIWPIYSIVNYADNLVYSLYTKWTILFGVEVRSDQVGYPYFKACSLAVESVGWADQ